MGSAKTNGDFATSGSSSLERRLFQIFGSPPNGFICCQEQILTLAPRQVNSYNPVYIYTPIALLGTLTTPRPQLRSNRIYGKLIWRADFDHRSTPADYGQRTPRFAHTIDRK